MELDREAPMEQHDRPKVQPGDQPGRDHPSLRGHRHLSDRFVAVLAAAIVGGEYPEGSSLPSESEFVDRYDLSKPTIRQGLAKLADVGLLRIQHGRRSIVLGESAWNVLSSVVHRAYADVGRGAELSRHLWEVRRLLEASASACAATRASEADMAELAELARRMSVIARTERNIDEFLEVDHAFHDLIARASGNPALRCVIRPTHEFLSGLWDRQSRTLPGHLEQLAEQHERISRAIGDREAEAAEGAMTDHIAYAERLESGDG